MVKKDEYKRISQNKKARHDYFVEQTFEAGMVLAGTEVKSLRGGRVNLRDSYAAVTNGELYAYNLHISPYEQGNRFNADPMRPKKLLMHKSEINKLQALVKQKGYTLVPLNIYLKRGIMKLELGLCRGKQQHDKRSDLAERSAKLEIQRTLREQNR